MLETDLPTVLPIIKASPAGCAEMIFETQPSVMMPNKTSDPLYIASNASTPKSSSTLVHALLMFNKAAFNVTFSAGHCSYRSLTTLHMY